MKSIIIKFNTMTVKRISQYAVKAAEATEFVIMCGTVVLLKGNLTAGQEMDFQPDLKKWMDWNGIAALPSFFDMNGGQLVNIKLWDVLAKENPSKVQVALVNGVTQIAIAGEIGQTVRLGDNEYPI